jgi:hypothetical protein
MSGPVGSAYPGNLVTSVFACFFLILSAKSALSAYRLWRRNRRPQTREIEYIRRYGRRIPQSWEANIGFSVFAFVASMFAFYAVWVHR